MNSRTVAVIGNPNSGKTTLFNDLTGAHQRTGNWPGVTVEKKEGQFMMGEKQFKLIDLPGTYSLDNDHTSIDEQITCRFLLAKEAEIIINIIDASSLERSLYLTLQLLEMDCPVIVVLNMMDLADLQGWEINREQLADALGCPVIPMVAKRHQGIDTLKAKLLDHKQIPASNQLHYQPDIEAAITTLDDYISQENPISMTGSTRWDRLQWLSGEAIEELSDTPQIAAKIAELKQSIESEYDESVDLLIADQRFEIAHSIANNVVQKTSSSSNTFSDAIDTVVLNRWLGIPIFLFAIYLMFSFTINLGGAFIDFFDQATGALLVDGLGAWLNDLGLPLWLNTLLSKGLGGGIQVVATFIPIIGFLYLFLSFLEDSGYMARAAFVMERFMRRIGLPGKAFVPLIVGFGCNVPGIMAARTMEVERERIITIMMSPFMSCGARLSVYALFAAAFFQHNGQNIVFLLYLVGIAAAIFTGFLLKSTLLQGEPEAFLLQLPTYQLPSLKSLLLHTWLRLKGFISDAGRYIVIMVMVINVLSAWGIDGSFNNENTQQSVLSEISKKMTPIFEPFGIHEDNWPATVGIFTGILAKEVVVGTLDATYSQLDQPSPENNEPFELKTALIDSLKTIPDNLKDSLDLILDPLGLSVLLSANDQKAAAEEQEVSVATFGAMEKRFDGAIGAFAYLLFILLYFPCVAATSAVQREAGSRWMWFAIAWTTGLAYMVSTLFYQSATYSLHPQQSAMWITIIIAFFGLVYLSLYLAGRRHLAHLNLIQGQPLTETGATEKTNFPHRNCCK